MYKNTTIFIGNTRDFEHHFIDANNTLYLETGSEYSGWWFQIDDMRFDGTDLSENGFSNTYGYLTIDHYPIMIPLSVYNSIQVMNYQIMTDFKQITDST